MDSDSSPVSLAGGIAGQALDAIERGVGAQTRLIEDLLDVSRMISGKLRIEIQIVELMPLLQAAIEPVRFDAEAKAGSNPF